MATQTPPDTAGTDDDAIVLPWWQHPVNILTLLVATALIAGMLGWLAARSSSEVASSDVDVGFLQDMRVHHEQAVDMSFIYLDLPDTDPRLRTVARSIIVGQGIEIGLMIQLLRDMDAPTEGEPGEAMGWMGHAMNAEEMPGMAGEHDLRRLAGSEGAAADSEFVELMTAHHRGGIDMARVAAEDAKNATVRRMAASMADSQEHEIVEMEDLLARPPRD